MLLISGHSFENHWLWVSLLLSAEKAMAPHSSTLAWKVPWMEEPGGLQSMGSHRVRHDWTPSLSLSLSCTGEGNGNPLQCSCLENPRDWGAWWAAVYGVTQSRTRLKRLSSSSSSCQHNEQFCLTASQENWFNSFIFKKELIVLNLDNIIDEKMFI